MVGSVCRIFVRKIEEMKGLSTLGALRLAILACPVLVNPMKRLKTSECVSAEHTVLLTAILTVVLSL